MKTQRHGTSLLEVTGCVLAVAVGVWLGARYLGLDLHAAAYTTLADTAVMDSLPADWRLPPPPGMEPLTPEQQAAALSAELEALRLEAENLDDGEPVEVSTVTIESNQSLHPMLLERREHTLAFWSKLGGIRGEVERLQATADESLNEQNVFKVLEVRRRAYLYGAKAVKLAMSDNIDPQALQFAEQLASWYQHGADLYAEAINVWQGQHLPNSGLSSDKLLEQVQQQHNNEAMLLFEKSGRLCEVLFRRYQVAFPSIEEPKHDNQ
ncbi:hypothetical protein [Aeoliella mucimassa]|nr:hypothetical protein [Aeoliella mucimassa]